MTAASSINTMRRFFYVLLLISINLSVLPLMAGTVTPAAKQQLKNDSSQVTPRKFDQQKIQKYSEQHAFDYREEVAGTNYWTRFWAWVWDTIRKIFDNKYTGSLLKYAALITLLGLVIFAVIKIIGLDLGIISGKSKPIEVPFTESMDNIHEIDFNQEIARAIENANYRLAVRLCYLFSLKKLSDHQLIDWQPEKTNETYILELKDTSKRAQFSLLTRQFEYVWYGEFFIDREKFSSIKERFDEFNERKR